ncbi:MAG TPA: zf-HC2 domain-containing protein [Thermoanaerobaculia bacterium]
MTHLDDSEVERFLDGDLPPDERRQVVRHLLKDCEPCRAKLASLSEVLFRAEDLQEDARGIQSFSYDAALARAANRAHLYQTRHRKERELLEQALDTAPPGAREDEEIYWRPFEALRGWSRVEALLQLSFEERYRDPGRMLLLALAARLAAEKLSPAELGPGLVTDFQARAWAEVGNAYRVNEQFDFAEAALAHAQNLLEEGTGDSLLIARLADVKASLRIDQRRLSEAIDLLQVVYSLYHQAGDPHLAGRALVSEGIATHYSGLPRDATQLLREGLKLIDSTRDPQLAATGSQSLVHALTDCGEFQEAGRLLLSAGLRQAFVEDPLNLLKLRWMEGKVLAGLGKLGRAERTFEQVREEFFLREREYDAALVGLELAAVRLRQGKTAQVRELAEETYESLRDLGVHQEAFRAVLFLREACRRQAVTVSLLRKVHGFLVRLEWNPQLRFEP